MNTWLASIQIFSSWYIIFSIFIALAISLLILAYCINRNQRYLTQAILYLTLIIILGMGNFALAILCLLLFLIINWEIIGSIMNQQPGSKVMKSILIINTIILLAFGVLIHYDYLILSNALVSYTVIAISVLLIIFIIRSADPKVSTNIILLSLLQLLFALSLFLLVQISQLSQGMMWVALIMFITNFTDSAAYLFGKHFGRHKLCHRISPKKTIEGTVSGIIIALLSATILYYILPISMNILTYYLIVLTIAVYSTLGDLFASLVKRSLGFKDFGNTLPGHGGFIDRLDSLLLVIPVTWLLL